VVDIAATIQMVLVKLPELILLENNLDSFVCMRNITLLDGRDICINSTTNVQTYLTILLAIKE